MSGLRVPPGAGPGTAPQRAQDAAPDQPPSMAGPAGPALRMPGLGAVGWLRWTWRQLTSMRTALVLLFLLAVASVPGSALPQEGIDPAAVTQYYAAHPALAPILNRLSLFNVFAAPWFAAIYLLLFASLAGCVLPRAYRLARGVRQLPPRAPRNLSRLPYAASYTTALAPDAATAGAGRLLAGRRFRLRTGDGWVAAEKGYLREVGNLLFHLALLALLSSVALGGLFGYKANKLLVQGDSFGNTPTSLDVFHPGRLVSGADLQPFSISLDKFTASYVTSGPELGQPVSYNAALRYRSSPAAPVRSYLLRVNHPLVVDGVRVYIIGHGYAPEFTITDGAGKTVFQGPVPFIPVDQNGLTSEGVIKVPDAVPEQLGFAGLFLPTAVAAGGRLESVFPAALDPRVSLVSYAGNLGMNSGPPQSVYQLDRARMHRLPISPQPLAPGQSMKLPDHAGTLTFTGYKQWISLAITYDPGQAPALISAFTALAGLLLSFMVRRCRIFVRAYAGPDGTTMVDMGGLARSDAAGGLEQEFDELAGQLRMAQDGTARVPVPPARPGPAAAPAAAPGAAEAGTAAETAAADEPGRAAPGPDGPGQDDSGADEAADTGPTAEAGQAIGPVPDGACGPAGDEGK
ncbi:MAG: cytochrome c biogenesis protein ResB [Streptosporangiaceae bacterium]